MIFINREKELKSLNQFYELSKKKCFPIVIYGQRRVGKTRLVKKFIKDNNSIYFFVDDAKNPKILLEEYSKILKENKFITEYEKIENWESFFKVIFSRLKNQIVVFDEFQNFLHVDISIFSILQKNLDENEETPLMLIFLGSIIGMMKSVFEDEKAPLFGRMKSFYHLKPLNFSESALFLKKLGYNDFSFFIEFYSIFGGYPRYYTLLKDYEIKTQDILEILSELVLKENAILKNEVMNNLKLNFGNGKTNYYMIIEAISQGNTSLTQIANYVGLTTNSINPFLNELVNYYEFIQRDVPITIENQKFNKQGIYSIENNFFNFYFKFIHKNQHLTQLEKKDKILDIIKENYKHLVSKKFEQICIEWMKKTNNNYSFGKWRNRKGDEIDVVGINKEKKEIIFGECKWTSKPVSVEIYNDLLLKKELVDWNNKERKEKFVFFSKSGFDKKMEEFAKKQKNILLITLKDLEKGW